MVAEHFVRQSAKLSKQTELMAGTAGGSRGANLAEAHLQPASVVDGEIVDFSGVITAEDLTA